MGRRIFVEVFFYAAFPGIIELDSRNSLQDIHTARFDAI